MTNTGTIRGEAVSGSSSTAYAAGVSIGNSVTGTLTNQGTISASASYEGSSATAVGVYLSRLESLGSGGGSLSNSGTISAEAEGYYASAKGLSVVNQVDQGRTITNNGTIGSTANSVGGSANSSGVFIGYLQGSLTNEASGLISAKATAKLMPSGGGSNATAAALDFVAIGGSGGASDVLVNKGVLVATATSDGSWAEANGIRATYVNSGASITNSTTGSIKATAISGGTNATDGGAFGINVVGFTNGSIINAGTITATASGAGTRQHQAVGVDFGYLNQGATVSNSGTITAMAGDTTALRAAAVGLLGGEDNSNVLYTGEDSGYGSIVNTKTISAKADAQEYAYAYGALLGELREGASLDNQGVISAQAMVHSADSGGGAAYAYGVSGSLMGATLTNDGTISAVTGASGYARGLVLGSITTGSVLVSTSSGGYYADVNSSVVNSGTISAVAGGGASGFGVATGVNIGYLASDSTFTNEGSIKAEAAGVYYADAKGVYISNLSGTFTNTQNGTISAKAALTSPDGWANAASGVYISYMNGTFDNYGTIKAEGEDGNTYSMNIQSGGGSVYNAAHAEMSGSLYVGGNTNVNNEGKISLPDTGSAYIGGGTYSQYGQDATLELGVTNNTDQYASLYANTVNLGEDSTLTVRVAKNATLHNNDVISNVISANTLWALQDLPSGGGTVWTNVDTGTINLAVTDNSYLFDFTADRDGNTIDLTANLVNGRSVTEAMNAAGNKGNGQLAAILDELMQGNGDLPADLDPLLGAIQSAGTQQEVADALERMGPILRGNAGQIIGGGLHGVNRIIQSRQNNGMNSGDDFAGDRMIWAKPLYAKTKQDDKDGVTGYEADTSGLVLGFDAPTDGATRLGVAVALLSTDVEGNNTDAPTSADITTRQFALYGSHSLSDTVDLNMQADFGRIKTQGKRRTTLGNTAKSDVVGAASHFGVGLGKRYSIGQDMDLTATARVDYAKVTERDYVESGAGIENLTVSQSKSQELITSVDGKLNYAASKSTTLSANLGLGYDSQADEGHVSTAFAIGGPAWETKGIAPSPLVMRAGLGVTLVQAGSMEISGRYDAEARDSFLQQAVSLKFRMPF